MRVLLFGPLSDLAGWRSLELEAPAGTLDELRALLARRQPELGSALAGRGVQVAVDQTLIRGSVALAPGSEVAFLPPMSGG